MKLKRVLVLVMALIMVVSTCVTPVGAAFKSETKHEHLEDVLNNPEYTEKYEEIKAMVESIAKDIAENQKEYYAEGYAYADEQGYIGAAIYVIELMLETLPGVDLNGLGLTEELQAKLETELDALVPTLEKLEEILKNEEASEFDGFVNALLSLEGDLYLHMNNVYAILEQGSVDLNQLYLVPAFDESLRLINEEVIPAIENAVVSFVEGVVDYVVEVARPYYEMAVEIIGIAEDAYDDLVETIVQINIYVEDAIEYAADAYEIIVEKIVEIYEKIKDAYAEEEVPEEPKDPYQDALDFAIRTVCAIYNNVLNTVLEIAPKVELAIEQVKDVVNSVVTVYVQVIDFLVVAYGTVENAVIVAGQVYDYVKGIIIKNIELVKTGLKYSHDALIQVYNDIAAMVMGAPSEADAFVSYMAAQLAAYVAGILSDIDAFLNDVDAHILEKDYSALNGRYELKDDSAYVAIGNSPFGAELAESLYLSSKYSQFGVRDSYLGAIANADLVTINVDNGEFLDFANRQVAGTIGAIVRNNDRLMELYEHQFIGGYVSHLVSEAGIDVDAVAEELNWSLYLNAEDKQMLENALALVKAELLTRGIPEYYYIDLQPMVDQALEENGLSGLPGFAITMDPIEVPVADIIVYAIESALYAYARFTNDLNVLLDNIYAVSPAATVVLLGIDNPLAGMNMDLAAFGIDFINFEDCVAISDMLIKTFNVQLYAAALKNENTVFVPEKDADAILEAIHAFCQHVYEDCEDEECNRCFAVRVAPGHNFSAHVYNNDATCTKDGTQTATCQTCGATETRVKENTMLKHDMTTATCKAAAKCKSCGYTDNKLAAHTYDKATCTEDSVCKVCGKLIAEATGHRLSSWKTVVEATRKTTGLEERVCLNKDCDYCESNILDIIPPKYTPGTIVAVILSAVLFAIAVSSIILWRLRKKDILK